ncbi:MAG: 6-pyruvoyl-tetrahydropterin synthase-related protein [Anaerolineae bacterium]
MEERKGFVLRLSPKGWRIDPYLFLTLLLTVFALGPLLQPGYFWGAHDARHNVYFLFEFDRSIQDGIWYPRWAPDFTFGYGYPFFNIYGPLASYVGEVFHLVGFGFVNSVKIVFGLSIVFSGLAMYLFVRRLMGPKAGLVAALVYVYVPYHVFDLYVRAALAESVTYVFVPLVLWGCYETVQNPRLTNIVGLSLAYAGLMFTNNLITLLYSLLVVPAYLIMLVLAKINQTQRLRELSRESFFPLMANLLRISIPPLAGILLGLGLSAIFWIPSLTEFKYVRVDQWYAGRYDYRDDFVYFFQLFSPTWGFGASGPGPDDTVSFQLGAVPFVLSVLSLAVLKQAKDWALRRQILFFQAVTLIAIFLLLPAAATTWELLSPVRFAQFPWRYLTFTVLSTAVLAGSILNSQFSIPNSQSPVSYSLLILVTLVILGSYPYLQVEIAEPAEGPVSLAGLMLFQQSADEMTGSTAWVKEIPEWSPMADNYIAGLPVESKLDQSTVPEGAAAAALEWGTTYELVQYKAPIRDDKHFTRLTFNLFYYPGWRAYLVQKHDRGLGIVGKAEIEPEDGPLGRITVKVPGNRRYLLLRFEDTPVRIWGTYISLVSMVIVLLAFAGRAYLRRRYGTS